MTLTHREIVQSFWDLIDLRDYEKLRSLLADTFTLTLLPSSLGGLGEPVRNREQSFEFLKKSTEVVASYKMEYEEFIQTDDTIVAHYHTTGEQVKGGPYRNEFIGIFRFQGEKLLSLKEFVDSKYVTDLAAARN